MTPVFISYDRRDKYFVNLLGALLEHENIDSWCDRERIAAGDLFERRIQEGLQSSQSLITVVSKNAVESKWVTAEFATFCAGRPNPLVIPVVIDATPPGQVFHALAAYQAVDMSEDMLHGFVTLCDRFDRRFLSGQAQRRGGERRDSRERRQNPMRRLRMGLWQAYASATGAGKFDKLEFSRATQQAKIAEALEEEILRYELLDESHKQIDSRWALKCALKTLSSKSDEIDKAVYVMESVAAYLYEHYEVKSKSRRDRNERRTKTSTTP